MNAILATQAPLGCNWNNIVFRWKRNEIKRTTRRELGILKTENTGYYASPTTQHARIYSHPAIRHQTKSSQQSTDKSIHPNLHDSLKPLQRDDDIATLSHCRRYHKTDISSLAKGRHITTVIDATTSALSQYQRRKKKEDQYNIGVKRVIISVGRSQTT